LEQQSFNRNHSGQVLIVSALLIAMLMLSTSLYVIEVGKEVPTVDSNEVNFFSGYKQALRSTLISALANATDGGNMEVLTLDLNELKTVLLSNSYQALLTMDYNTLNSSDYQNGIWISWGTNGQGISSTYVWFVFATSSLSATSNAEYEINVTSQINLTGIYHQLDDVTKQVNLTFTLKNDGNPALCQKYAVSYRNTTSWVAVDLPGTTSFCNGTYTMSFEAETAQLNEPLEVSFLCQDQRGIFVGANLTCTNL
jgi:hypothetical protein